MKREESGREEEAEEECVGRLHSSALAAIHCVSRTHDQNPRDLTARRTLVASPGAELPLYFDDSGSFYIIFFPIVRLILTF